MLSYFRFTPLQHGAGSGSDHLAKPINQQHKHLAHPEPWHPHASVSFQSSLLSAAIQMHGQTLLSIFFVWQVAETGFCEVRSGGVSEHTTYKDPLCSGEGSGSALRCQLQSQLSMGVCWAQMYSHGDLIPLPKPSAKQ